MTEGPAVKRQAHFTDGGFAQLNQRRVSRILKAAWIQPSRDPGPACSWLLLFFITECGFSGFHSGAGLWLVTRQLELSQPGWFKIPEHQSPIKMRRNLLIIHVLNLV